MQSFDLYSEKQLREAFDAQAQKTLVKEADKLERKESSEAKAAEPGEKKNSYELQTLTTKDKMELAALSILIGHPIFMFGLGTAFSVMDDIDFRRQQAALALSNDTKLRFMGSLRADGREEETIQSDKIQLKPECTFINPLDTSIAAKKKDATTLTDIAGVPAKNRLPLNRRLDNSNRFVEAGKLIKQKILLSDQIKLLSQTQDYKTVCKLDAEVQSLDKALKGLGYAV